MKRSNYNLFLTLLVFSIGVSIPFLMSSIPVQEEQTINNIIQDGVTSPQVPDRINFAGEPIKLTRYDCRERMDRELTTFTYMHSTTLLMIKRANRFFPVIEPILKANGVPDDFKYLMVIESNLHTLARSPAGAAGLWQIMESTGREIGLKVNNNIDERYHVEKATRAACKYFKEAYAKYGNWISTAASYNAGQRRISTSLKQQGVDSAMDLWLNEETSRYIYRMMAAKLVLSNPKAYGFLLTKENLYPVIAYDTITVTTGIPNLMDFARQQGITYAQLKDANPWLRDTLLENKSGRSYTLKIPTKEGMNYNPSKTIPHNTNWITPSH